MNIHLPDSWEEAKRHVLPSLQPITTTLARIPKIPNPPQPVWRHIAPHVAQRLVFDTERFRIQLTEQHLQRWNATADQAFHAAWENLPAHTEFSIDEHKCWHVVTEDGYENARLSLPGWLQSFADRMEGEPVAVVPHARALIVGDSASPRQIQHLCHLASKQWREEGEPISPVLYTSPAPGRLSPWKAPESLPLDMRKMIDASKLALRQHAYNSIHDGFEPPIARLEVGLRQESQTLYSFCRWCVGQSPLLPPCDFIIISSEDGRPFYGLSWSKLTQFGVTTTIDVAHHQFHVPTSPLRKEDCQEWRVFAVDPNREPENAGP